MSIRVLARTPHEIVVLKPAGMASELTDDPAGASLLARVRALPGASQVRLCHRLDRVTRGIVVLALTREAAAFHGAKIAAREWHKLYVGHVARPPPLGIHRAFLREKAHRVEVVRAGGRPSALEVIATAGAQVLVRLMTGRRHQVRVMLAELGAPLVGDPLYGGVQGRFRLEHLLLGFPAFEGDFRVIWEPDDPEREPLEPELLSRLDTIADELRR